MGRLPLTLPLGVVVALLAAPPPQLRVVEVRRDVAYELRFGAALVARTDASTVGSFPVLRELGAVGPFERVVLVSWEGPSQGCLDYGYSLLGLRADGTFARRDMNHCARVEPEVVVRGARITVRSPAYTSFDGEGVAAKQWTFDVVTW